MKKVFKYLNYIHVNHLVTISPWPLFLSLSIMGFLVGILSMFSYGEKNLMYFELVLMILILYQWWRDVVREGTFQGFHTIQVYQGLRMGMILFIISELFFFVSFFWAFFHMSLSPSVELGMMWPPKGIEKFDPFCIPLLNTMILLSSGVTVTWSHLSLLSSDYEDSIKSLQYTIFLGVLFTILQVYEYLSSKFTVSDSVYGSVFYILTGFHGFHVLVGTALLMVMLIRMYFFHFSSNHHFGFEGACWYWHFVDVIWLFLFLFIYWWVY